MNKKGSMELSVNAIVILVIAIVMLGLILGFVKSKFGEIGKGLESQEPDAPSASSAEPITVSRTSITANPGDVISLKAKVYNADTASATVGIIIGGCNDATVVSDVQVGSAKEILPGQQESFALNFKVPASVSAGTNTICSISLTDYDGDAIINPVDVSIKVIR